MEKVLGKFAPSYKGDYVPGTYQMFDVVFDGESSFMSLKNDNAAALASDGINWIYLCRGNAESALMKRRQMTTSSGQQRKALCNLHGRIQALEQFITNAVFNNARIHNLDVVDNLNMYKNSNLIKIGTPRLIGFDLATGGTFSITMDGIATANIVYTNASTFASITTQITDELTAIGKTIALGYQVINGFVHTDPSRLRWRNKLQLLYHGASGKVKKTASPITEPDFG